MTEGLVLSPFVLCPPAVVCVYVGQCPRAHLAGVTTVVADRFASILPEVSQSAICLFYPFPAPQDGQLTALPHNHGANVCDFPLLNLQHQHYTRYGIPSANKMMTFQFVRTG